MIQGINYTMILCRWQTSVLQKYYFIFLFGMDFGGLSKKYPNRSFIMYENDLSFFFDIFSRNDLISFVVLNVIDSVFPSFILIKCKTNSVVYKRNNN